MPTVPRERLDAFLAELREEFPFVRVVEKRGPGWRLLHHLVAAFTLGGNRRFQDGYWTTIGATIGHPPGVPLDDRDLPVLRHERVHLRQQERAGIALLALVTLGAGWPLRRRRWWRRLAFAVGGPPHSIAYLLLPLPLGLAWCRYALEREAYAESVRCAVEAGGDEAGRREIERAVGQICGPGYGWAWPFPGAVRRWLGGRMGGN